MLSFFLFYFRSEASESRCVALYFIIIFAMVMDFWTVQLRDGTSFIPM